MTKIFTKVVAAVFLMAMMVQPSFCFGHNYNESYGTYDLMYQRGDILDIGGNNLLSSQAGNDISVFYRANGSDGDVIVSAGSYAGYKIYKYTSPYRYVLDIPHLGTPSGQKTISVNNGTIGSIRYAQFDKNIFRVVVDLLVAHPGHQTEEKSGELVLKVKCSSSILSGNIEYKTFGDRAQIILSGIKLTNGYKPPQKLYTENYDETEQKYIISFSNSLGVVSGSILAPSDDKYINSIEVVKDSSVTTIIVNAKRKLFYNTIAREQWSNTAINLLSRDPESDKLVVIDAGHGGSDPGAVKAGLDEKLLNLDIALKLSALLKNRGINIYMTRETDITVGLYDRSYIANDLSAAIFTSIHNNSAEDSRANGTETWYTQTNSARITSAQFAGIVQSKLVSALGTRNRNTKETSSLAVLRTTCMPGALAEVAFMSNDGDLYKLKTDEFRQSAASALCSAILEALSK